MMKEIINVIQRLNRGSVELLKEHDVVYVFTKVDNEMIKHLYSNRNQLIETLINDINELEVFTQEIKDINTYILQMDKIYEIYNLEKGTSVGEIKCFIYTLNAYYRFLKRIDIRFKEKLGIA